MPIKAKHAFGSLSAVESAKQADKLNEFDILFLDGDTEPKIGWIDKYGNTRIVDTSKEVVTVTELPVAGEENVIYIYNDEAYIWNGTQCVTISKATDVSALEEDIAALETEMAKKVDEATVDSKISEAVSAATVEVIEF